MEYPGRAGLWWQLVCRREAAGGGCRGDLCGTYRHLAQCWELKGCAGLVTGCDLAGVAA